MHCHVLQVAGAVDTETLFARHYAARPWSFWLDSALAAPQTARFSFIGAPEGATGEVLSYRVDDDAVCVETAAGARHREPGSIFDALDRRLGRPVLGPGGQPLGLPFDFVGGYVGYFGYELKALLGSPNTHSASTPDAVWMRADRFVAVDHQYRRTYLVAVDQPGRCAAASSWLRETASLLAALPAPPATPSRGSARSPAGRPVDDQDGAGPDVAAAMSRSRTRYLADIAECRQELRAGESYEICLTDTAQLAAPSDELAYYRRLRRLNPAPYGALLRAAELTVFSASPERFLRIDADRTVTSKPIKGTAARSSDPIRDEALRMALRDGPKTRAEHLMIVDLVRNDLGRVCEVGSVDVPAFAAVESYATVHQLVSTVRGRLRPDLTAVDCVRACFPGGSMTGAPKLRSMEIIDRLERAPRGVYAGSLGYLGFGGSAQLSIVIRTAVRWRDRLSVGAGGAIVLDSDPEDEYRELLLKARATTRALPAGSRPSGSPDLVRVSGPQPTMPG